MDYLFINSNKIHSINLRDTKRTIVSSRPHEGKTHVLLKLAALATQQGMPVTIVNIEERREFVEEVLNRFEAVPGLVNIQSEHPIKLVHDASKKSMIFIDAGTHTELALMILENLPNTVYPVIAVQEMRVFPDHQRSFPNHVVPLLQLGGAVDFLRPVIDKKNSKLGIQTYFSAFQTIGAQTDFSI